MVSIVLRADWETSPDLGDRETRSSRLFSNLLSYRPRGISALKPPLFHKTYGYYSSSNEGRFIVVWLELSEALI